MEEAADSWPKWAAVQEPWVVVVLVVPGRGSCAVARPRMMSVSRGLEVGGERVWRMVDMMARARRKARGRREYRVGRRVRVRVWMRAPRARRVGRVKASLI